MSEKSVFGTREWAAHNENCIEGCFHNCRYCYARAMAARFGRRSPEDWHDERPRAAASRKTFRKKSGRIMFPTTHDITPAHLDVCLDYLIRMLSPGNDVLIVSKPHFGCIKTLCDRLNEYREQIFFRFTIASVDSDVLRFWEPGAPGFDERLSALKYAHGSGYFTSVSCEPMLDNRTDDLIRAVVPYVTDSVWVGRMNNPIARLRFNGEVGAIPEARRLMEMQGNAYVEDLYQRHRDNPQVKWKESIKKMVGLEVSKEPGRDV